VLQNRALRELPAHRSSWSAQTNAPTAHPDSIAPTSGPITPPWSAEQATTVLEPTPTLLSMNGVPRRRWQFGLRNTKAPVGIRTPFSLLLNHKFSTKTRCPLTFCMDRPPDRFPSSPPAYPLRGYCDWQSLPGRALLPDGISQSRRLRGRHVPERHGRCRLRHLPRPPLLRSDSPGGPGMSRRLLLPGRDGVCHGVSLSEWDLLERDELGGSGGVPSLPSWKVCLFWSALSSSCEVDILVVFSPWPCSSVMWLFA